MYKIAVFVEGYTELLFVNKLIEEITDNNRNNPMGGSNWKPITPTPTTPTSGKGGDSGGRFFVQGSKMNTGNFDDGADGDTPF